MARLLICMGVRGGRGTLAVAVVMAGGADGWLCQAMCKIDPAAPTATATTEIDSHGRTFCIGGLREVEIRAGEMYPTQAMKKWEWVEPFPVADEPVRFGDESTQARVASSGAA